MKKQILFLVMILLPMVASADAVEINGVYYNLITKGGTNGAEVTSNPNKYTGNVAIPESVTYENLNYSVTSIGSSAFHDCSGLTSITLPNSLTSIRNSAFRNCSGLTSIILPNSLTSIESSVFYGCSGLTSVTIPNSITSIESSVFSDCSGLISVTLPNSLTSIGLYAFGNCSGLTSITIPNNVESIEGGAFSGCTGMTSVTIPNSVTSIGFCAFFNCKSLTSVVLPNGVTNIGVETFMNCSALTSVTLPNSLTSIEEELFKGCTSLTSIIIPNSVSKIERGAFYGCSGLTSITIGSGIESINTEAFASCPNLTDVYCHAINVPNTHTDAFKDSYIDYATLHVPAESVNDYRAADPWKNFKSIVSLEGGDTPEPQKCEKPTISYNNGQLRLASATDGAECVTTISDTDVKTHYGNAISLTATYNISVYATKAGCENSETATATLCWIDKEPTTEGITGGVAQIPSKAVLIQSEGGILKVEGVDDGTQVAVYTPDGKQAGSAVCRNGAALVGTSIQTGNTAIVKIGEKTVKVIVK